MANALSVATKAANAQNDGLRKSVLELTTTVASMLISEPEYGIVAIPADDGSNEELRTELMLRNAAVAGHWRNRKDTGSDLLIRKKNDPIFELIARHLCNGLPTTKTSSLNTTCITPQNTEQDLIVAMFAADDFLIKSLKTGYQAIETIITKTPLTTEYDQYWDVEGKFIEPSANAIHKSAGYWAQYYNASQVLEDNA